MYKYIMTLAAFVITLNLSAQTAVGTWKTIDDEDGKVKSHIVITEVDGLLVGSISKLIDPEREICTACKGDNKDQPLVGMQIMWGLASEGEGEWAGGNIMDPKSGKTYKCKIALENANELKVRGFLGFALLGRTQTWYRVSE